MKKYLVTVEATWTIEVEAENEEEAVSMSADYDYFNNYEDCRSAEEEL